MRLVLMHLDNTSLKLSEGEEVMLIVPGAVEKVAVGVPLLALDKALPLVVETAQGVEQSCAHCGGDLAVVPQRDDASR